jgi:hypothetical protein
MDHTYPHFIGENTLDLVLGRLSPSHKFRLWAKVGYSFWLFLKYEDVHNRFAGRIAAFSSTGAECAARWVVDQRSWFAIYSSAFCRRSDGYYSTNAASPSSGGGGANCFATVPGIEVEAFESFVELPSAARSLLSASVKGGSITGVAVCSRPSCGARFFSDVRRSVSSPGLEITCTRFSFQGTGRRYRGVHDAIFRKLIETMSGY